MASRKGREVDILRGALRQDERKRGGPVGLHGFGAGHFDLEQSKMVISMEISMINHEFS